MDRVFAARTIKNVKFALASMPQKIDELYKLTLERIQQQAGDDGPLAMRILGWITHAKRPLSVNELQHGLAVEYDDDEDNDLNARGIDADNILQPESLIDVCAGLVIIDSASQIIRLVHYTTQEYFSNQRLNFFAGVEADISRACLTYLSYDIDTEETATILFQSNPFLGYASGHWFLHVHSSLSATNPAPEFSKAVARFKCSDSCLRSVSLLQWDSKYRMFSSLYFHYPNLECPDRESALEVASYWGVEELVTILLEHSTGSYPGLDTSLFYASNSGVLSVVNLLLRYGAQVNVLFDVSKFQARDGLEADTALGTAFENGHLSVAKVLIKNGAKPYVGDKPAMHAAALANEPVMVEFLLKEGVDVNARDPRKQTALHIAASYRVDLVKLLLDAHCDPDIQDNDGSTALHYAAYNGSVGTVKLLLDTCDPNLKNNGGETALHYAAHNGSVDVVKLLLDAHCDLDLKDNDGWTALHWAAETFPVLDVVELLLDGGADSSAKDEDGTAARTFLEDTLLSEDYEPGGPYYKPGNREKTETLIQRMIQQEQTASAPPVDDA